MVSALTFTDTAPGVGVHEYEVVAVINSVSGDSPEAVSAIYGASSYTDVNPGPGLQEYRVRAISGDLSGDWSNIISATFATSSSATATITLPSLGITTSATNTSNSRSATATITLPSLGITASSTNTTPYIPPTPPDTSSGEDAPGITLDFAIDLSI